MQTQDVLCPVAFSAEPASSLSPSTFTTAGTPASSSGDLDGAPKVLITALIRNLVTFATVTFDAAQHALSQDHLLADASGRERNSSKPVLLGLSR